MLTYVIDIVGTKRRRAAGYANENEEEGEDSSPENENQDDPNSTENQTRGGDIPSTFVDPARTGLVDPARTRSVDPART